MTRLSDNCVGNASSGADDVVDSVVIDTDYVHPYELTLCAWCAAVRDAVAYWANVSLKHEPDYTGFSWKGNGARIRKITYAAGDDVRVGGGR